MDTLGLLAAFGAGIASFLSPCVLPLIPVYVAGLAGTNIDGCPASASFRSTVPQAIAFTLGVSVVFVPLGSLAAYLGQLSVSYVNITRKTGAHC